MGHQLTGSARIARTMMARSPRLVMPWTMGAVMLTVSSVVAYEAVFPTAASRAEMALTLQASPALAVIFGPAGAVDTVDGFTAWRSLILGALCAALMAIFVTIRHSRALEDSGLAELLGASPIGRSARLAGAMLTAAVGSVMFGVITAGLTITVGGGTRMSLLLGASYTVTGLAFAGGAGLCAQLGSDARTATMLSMAALGVAFLARAYGDVSTATSWLTWAGPLGWVQHTTPGVPGGPWWPLLLSVALAAATAGAALRIQAGRDYGRGAVEAGPGPGVGHPDATILASLRGLILRLNKALLIAWAVAQAVMGTMFGYLSTTTGQLLTDQPALADLLAQSGASPKTLAMAFVTMILQMLAILAAIVGCGVMMRLVAEEHDHRIEPVLGRGVSRHQYFGWTAAIAFAGPTVIVLLASFLVGVFAQVSGSAVTAGDVIAQGAATIPAIWTLTAVAVAAVGLRPAVRVVAWAAVAGSFALTILGPLLRLDEWVLAISPLHHVPVVSADQPDWTGLIVITGITVALTVAGFVGFRRRDIG